MFIRSYEEEYVAKYTLPELSYDYGALEPHISGRIMELHHSKHHNTYVNGANNALEKLEAAREAGDFSTINQLTKDLAFNLGGHTNHSIFWNNLSPEGGDKPTGELASAIDERSEEHTSELQSRGHLVCRLLLEKKKAKHAAKPDHHPNDTHIC